MVGTTTRHGWAGEPTQEGRKAGGRSPHAPPEVLISPSSSRSCQVDGPGPLSPAKVRPFPDTKPQKRWGGTRRGREDGKGHWAQPFHSESSALCVALSIPQDAPGTGHSGMKDGWRQGSRESLCGVGDWEGCIPSSPAS